MSDEEALTALVRDLRNQIKELPARGIRDAAGNPYIPSYYKRGLEAAVAQGGTEVVEFVRRYLRKPPSAGFKKLEEADSLDLACEALVIDEDRPYAHLFSEDERALAHKRLAPHLAAIEARRTARKDRVEARRRTLPADLEELRRLAEADPEPEDAVAINTEVLRQDEADVVALIRLGRAHEALGHLAEAVDAYERATAVAPGDRIAAKRLADAGRLLRRRAAGA